MVLPAGTDPITPSASRKLPRLVFQFRYISLSDTLLARAPDKMIPGGHLLITRQLLEGLPAGNPNVMNFVD